MKNAQMYQVQVKDKRGESVLVGPRADNTDFLYPIVEAINKAVALGRESDWRNAEVVPVGNIIT